jgi:uncharacterized membrane protein YqjE
LAVSNDDIRAQQQGDAPQNIQRAIQDISDRTRSLVQEELELAKAEMTVKAQALGKGAAVGAAAAVFVLGALVLILHGIAWLIWDLLFSGTNYFWGFFIEAVLLLIVAAIAGLLAKRWISKGSPPKPDMAIDEAKLIKEAVSEPERAATLSAGTPPPVPERRP